MHDQLVLAIFCLIGFLVIWYNKILNDLEEQDSE